MDQIKEAQLNSDFLDDLLKVIVVVNMQKSEKQDATPQKQPETTELEENSVLHQASYISSTNNSAQSRLQKLQEKTQIVYLD